NFADVGMLRDRSESSAKIFGDQRDASEKLARPKVIQDSVAGRGRNGVGLVGEAVHEGSGAIGKGGGDTFRDKDGAEGRVAAGDALADENEVRFEVPVVDSKRSTRAADAGHNLIGDKKDAALP